jgi:hypothetical protein
MGGDLLKQIRAGLRERGFAAGIHPETGTQPYWLIR